MNNRSASYITYDPNTSTGFVIIAQYDSMSNNNNNSISSFKELSDFFYKNNR